MSGGVGEPVQVVVLDGYGVMWRTRDGYSGRLSDFAREHGATASDGEMHRQYLALTCGRITTHEFWGTVGASGLDLDAHYVDEYQPHPELDEFLRWAESHAIRIACLSNDATRWSRMLRTSFRLGAVAPWVVSADVGVRKPDRGIFDGLARQLGQELYGVFMVDDRAENLASASVLGMRPVLFRDELGGDDGSVRTFQELIRVVESG